MFALVIAAVFVTFCLGQVGEALFSTVFIDKICLGFKKINLSSIIALLICALLKFSLKILVTLQ